MKGKRPHSLMGKLSGLLSPGGSRTGLSDVLPSPTTPMGSKTRSPRGTGQFDLGAVGLGIVAMLGKSPTKHAALFRPVGLNPGKKPEEMRRPAGYEDRSEENYTYVTFAPGSVTYYEGDKEKVVFDVPRRPDVGVGVLPSLEFLSSCDLCGKKLHGRDVYMYRGEKAFCSTDCRSNHMMNDERKDQNCRSGTTPKGVDFSSSSCSQFTKDQIFSTGILAI